MDNSKSVPVEPDPETAGTFTRYYWQEAPSLAHLPCVQVARVTLLDPEGVKRDYLATVAGLLKAKDLAVLKIDAPASILQPAAIGQSSLTRVGQQVLAIGNPFGFDHTLTTGAISGLDRVIQSQVGALTRFMNYMVCLRAAPATRYGVFLNCAPPPCTTVSCSS